MAETFDPPPLVALVFVHIPPCATLPSPLSLLPYLSTDPNEVKRDASCLALFSVIFSRGSKCAGEIDSHRSQRFRLQSLLFSVNAHAYPIAASFLQKKCLNKMDLDKI